MSFGKEINWEYADTNNVAYLLSSVVKYSLEMKRVLISGSDWLLDSVNKSGHFEPSDWSAAEKTGDAVL